MSPRTLIRVGLSGGLPLAAFAIVGWSAGGSRIAGTVSARYVEQHPLAIPDKAAHTLVIGRAQGVNRSTGPTPYMDGGRVTNYDFGDLVHGNGPHKGYITMSQGADSMISEWSGKVTTTLSTKTPITTFEGTWTKVRGTGQYQDVTGKGTYRGRFTSQTEYTLEWSGEISGKGKAEHKP